jgi:manganese transport protein
VIAVGFDPSHTLVVSQVFLSFGIPFALIPLVLFCRDPKLMGNLVNHRVTSWAAYGVATLIIVLNAFLLIQTFV